VGRADKKSNKNRRLRLAEIGLNLVAFLVDDNNIPKILLFFQAICCWRCIILRFCGSEARGRPYSDKGMIPWHGAESVARLTVQAAGVGRSVCRKYGKRRLQHRSPYQMSAEQNCSRTDKSDGLSCFWRAM
jgi:hypothetical protein